MRKILAVMADTHAGAKQGLMPPDVQLLDDTGPEPRTWTPTQTAVQQWLWDWYVKDMASVAALAGKSPIVLVHNGDLTWGARYPECAVSGRAADQYAIAIANLEPWYKLRNFAKLLLVEGTGSHEFGEGSAPITVGAELAKRYPRVSTTSTRHGLLSIDGAKIDIAHHGPTPGGRSWLTGNQLRAYTRSVMLDDLLADKAPPTALLRAHYHTAIRETVREGGHTCEAFVLPSYCGMTHYAVQVTRSAYLLSCGMVALEFVDGALRGVHPFWRTLDLRQEEAV